MFTEYICGSPWENCSHRGWTAIASIGVQALAVMALMVAPILYTEGLPSLQFIARLVAPPSAPPSPPAASHARSNPGTSNLNVAGRPMTPQSIPRTILMIEDQTAPVRVGFMGIPNGTGERFVNNPVISSIASAGTGAAPPFPPRPVTHPPRISRMMEAYLVHRVQPDYPPLARSARIQGQVLLHAVISKDGSIENLRVLSGHPMLVAAAINAVRQWRYRPYVLNGEPVEVETQITVNFVLSGG